MRSLNEPKNRIAGDNHRRFAVRWLYQPVVRDRLKWNSFSGWLAVPVRWKNSGGSVSARVRCVV
ncbi:hypothetical protein [Nannocystis pusilla]|uniref:hypothetical protein n=1 Tax=Nannocystis pusilla TaxID=889268 RepID=UPI003B815689